MTLSSPMRWINLRLRGAKSFQRIIVDLTPVRPGGENGGAKLLATELVRQFSRNVAPQYEYVLLTSNDTHDELSWLDAANVRRLCVNERQAVPPTLEESGPSSLQAQTIDSGEPDTATPNHSSGARDQGIDLPKPRREISIRTAIRAIGQTLERNLPRSVYNPIYQFYRTYLKAPQTREVLLSLEADLIFCPFTAPLYQRPGVPIVIVVHDLQYQAYPQFFSDEDLYYTEHYFRQSCQAAARMICVSEFTRQSVLASSDVPPERVVAILSSLFNQLETVPPEVAQQVLNKYHLRESGYLLYPANFWYHKNHEMLLTAFSMFLARRGKSDLRLVLTGSPGDRMESLRRAAQEMGVRERVLFPGFVPAQEYSALLQGCLGLIFPSLYEGFGAPVIEAMAFGKPVLCSNLTSLPEVTQLATHLFDPRKPDEIVVAIEKLHDDADYRQELVARGRRRVSALMTPTEWASAYFDIFRQVMGKSIFYSNTLYGVHPDHWAGDILEITIVEGDEMRHLELTLGIPAWLPEPFLTLQVKDSHGNSRYYKLPRGGTQTLQLALQRESSKLWLSFSPSVSPSALGLNQDTRLLSCQVLACKLVTTNRSDFLYKAES